MAAGSTVKRSRHRARGVITVVDVGSTKTHCIIARPDGDGPPRVIGRGVQVSAGIRAGVIVDMEAAETSIGAAVHAAEQMAGETARGVFVNISGGSPEARVVGSEISVQGREIGEADVRRVAWSARDVRVEVDRLVVQTLPLDFTLDGTRGIADPRGLNGDRLGARALVITARAGAVRNLRNCVARCHLNVEATISGPYAAALSTLVPDERELGGVCVDMGGGTTGIAVFNEGRMVWTDTVPVGGQHVTNDVARGLTTSVAVAERLKTLHGAAQAGESDDREMIDVPQVGEESGPPAQLPRSRLINIIQPRLEEIFELARDRLVGAGVRDADARRLVLTGGAGQLPGARELAQQILNKQVRIGRPVALPGLPDAESGPAAAAAVGLLLRAADPGDDLSQGWSDPVASGIWGRVGLWLRENL